MPKVLLVTNDFPPTLGGIQSYLRDFLGRLSGRDIVVFCSTQDSEAAERYDRTLDYQVVRWPHAVMLPTPATARRLRELIEEHGIETVWFGAAAPLGLMAPAARAAGATRVVATTHGHEVGWSMLPGARQLLRRVFRSADVVTYISEYTRRRLRKVLADARVAHLPSGVDLDYFRPADPEVSRRVRERYGIASEALLVVVISRLVPRKGQDQLIRCWPSVRAAFPDARLLVVGEGRYAATLEMLIARADSTVAGRVARSGLDASTPQGTQAFTCPQSAGIRLTGRLERDDMRDLLAAADLFAMPARTRFGGLDVEGLGIVYLEAQACGVPVIAGRSGGAPETVVGRSGVIVDGRDEAALAEAIRRLLGDAQLRDQMGKAGREYVTAHWSMGLMTQRLRQVLGLHEAPSGDGQDGGARRRGI